ncbi:MAG: hypothetical protein HY225_00780 [Candidatus Vogelbacteria bacterium]|nr:hypothetical protein [Candidatus Vogelbacteria bacterium]
MSLIEKLEKQFGQDRDVVTMDHILCQEKLAAQNLVLDFRIAVQELRDDALSKFADSDLGETMVTVH